MAETVITADPGSPVLTPQHARAALRGDVPSLFLGIMLLAVPLYRTRVLEDSFNTPKVALLLLVGLFAGVALLARRGVITAGRWYAVPWLMMGLAVWHGATVLWAGSKPLGVDGTVYFAVFAVLAWLFTRAPGSLVSLRFLFNMGSAAAAVTAAWVLLDDFSKGSGGIVARLPDWRGKLSAGLGNSGHIAGMVGMFLPWVVIGFLTSQRPQRWLLLPVILLMFAALIVTWSVGSCGASLVALAVWGVVAFKTGGAHFRWKRLAAVIGVGLVAVAFYFLPSPANPHKPNLWSQAFSSQRWEAGWPTRLVIWKTSWQIISQNSLLGAGAGNFTYQYTQQVVLSVQADPVLRVYAGAFTNDAHNDFLQLWAEGGIIALAIWVGVLACFLSRVVHLLRRDIGYDSRCLVLAAGAGMTVFVLDGLMSFPMRLPAHFMCAVFFLSVPGVLSRLISGNAITASPVGRPLNQRQLRTAGIGLMLTLAACAWHHAHRVVAEYHLKAGRGEADGARVEFQGQNLSAWALCDALYQQALQAAASGAGEETWRGMLAQLNALASEETMAGVRARFESAHQADKWYANASSRLGQLYLFQGNYADSLRISRRTLRTLEAYEIHERMGAAAFFSGDHKTARDHWLTCLNRRPEMSDFYSALLARLDQQP